MSAAAKPARDSAARPDPGFAVEATAIGLQSLVPGVVPITTAARLAARAAAPVEPAKPQRPCDLVAGSRNGSGGAVPPGALFDLNATGQLDLFQPRQDADPQRAARALPLRARSADHGPAYPRTARRVARQCRCDPNR